MNQCTLNDPINITKKYNDLKKRKSIIKSANHKDVRKANEN